MNNKAAGLMAYIFWIVVGIFLGIIICLKFICKC